MSEPCRGTNTNLIIIWRVKSKQNTGQRIPDESEKTGRKKTESDRSTGGFARAASFWLKDPWLTVEQLCTRLHGTKGTQDASWDKETLTHAHPLPALQNTSSLHCIIPLRLSQGLFFVVVINATSMEFERLCSRKGGRGRPQTSLPFALVLVFSSPRCRALQVTSGLQMRPSITPLLKVITCL